MTDAFSSWAADQDAQADQRRRAALQERAQGPMRVNREGSRPPLIRGDNPATGGNIEDRRPQQRSLLDQAGGALNRIARGANAVLNPSSMVADQLSPDARTRSRNAQTRDDVTGVLAGIVRAPGVLVGSLMDFSEDTNRFVGEIGDRALTRVGAGGFARAAAAGRRQQDDTRQQIWRALGQDSDNATWSDLLSARGQLGKIGNDGINQGTAVITASVIPALMTGGIGTGVVGVGARTLAVGAFGGGVVNDPYQERISNGMQQLGIHTEFTDWLAMDGDDSVMESRFKGALEGALTEGAFEAVFFAAKAAKQLLKGDTAGALASREASRAAAGIDDTVGPQRTRTATPEEAAQENLDKTFAQTRTEEARAKQITDDLAKQEQADGAAQQPGGAGEQASNEAPGKASASGEEAAQGPEVLDAGTRAVDATGTDDLLQDANAALTKAGAPELDELVVLPNGKIAVSAETKAIMDEAGMGRPFAIAESTGVPKDDIIFATSGGRIVGNMDRASVQGFKDEVARYAEEGVSDVPASNPAGAFKITSLGDPENVQPLLRALIDSAPVKAKVSVQEMHEMALKVADEIGEDATSILAFAQGVAQNADEMTAAIAATRTMWHRLGSNLDSKLTANIDELGEDAFKDLAQDIHNIMTFTGSWAQTKTGMGRGLYATRLTDADTYLANVGKHGDDALTPVTPGAEPPLPRTREEVKDWVETWKAFEGDPRGRALWLERKLRVPGPFLYTRTAVANLFTANLLSAPRTLALNVVGPAIISTVRTLEKSAGGFIGGMMPWVPASQRAEMMAAAAAAPRAYLQAFGDMQDAFHFATQALKRGEPILGGGGSIRDAAGTLGPVSPRLLKAAQSSTPAWAYNVGNVINLWPRALQKVNAGLDEFSKRIAYLGEARAGLLVEGGTKGLRGTELNEYVRAELTKATDVMGHATNEDLLRSAERSTFTGEVGSEGSLSRGFAGWLAKGRQQYPELRFIMPIFNVPANALGETLRRVPVANVLFKESREELIGALGPVRQAEAYGRFLSGTALLGSGFALSRMGLITGGGPKDPRDRQIWLQTHQPYSLRVGDQWVDYSRYDLIGAMLAIPASLFDRSVFMPQDKTWENMMYGGIAAMAEYMKDRAALQTLSELMSFSGSPTSNPESFFERLIGTTAANIAVPNFVTQLGRNPTDDVIRAKASTADYILDKLPFASQTLDPVRNIFGEYVHKPQDSLLEGAFPITMAQAVSFADDPEMDEISRLYEATGYAAGVMSPRQTMGGAFDPREVKLPGGWSLWNEIMRNRGLATNSNGRDLRGALADLFASDEYNDAIDADASNENLSDGRKSRGALVADVFTEYNKLAQTQTARESPEAARWIAVAKAKRTDDGILRPYSAQELVDSPDLLSSLGIDITQYEAKVTGQ